MSEPHTQAELGPEVLCLSTALNRGAHAHSTESLGPGWGPVSLVSEGASLAALHLQQSSSAVCGMDE